MAIDLSGTVRIQEDVIGIALPLPQVSSKLFRLLNLHDMTVPVGIKIHNGLYYDLLQQSFIEYITSILLTKIKYYTNNSFLNIKYR